MHFARELWTDYADQSLHARLMDALEGQHGHRILAGVEAAKIACSVSNENTQVALDFWDQRLAPTLTTSAMTQTLEQALGQVVNCAQRCVQSAGVKSVDAVYLTGGSSALRPLTDALQAAMPNATLVQGNRFGGVAAGLAWAGQVANHA
jgi:hypothetical chaperone protein